MPLVISETGCTTAVGAMQVPVAASRFDRLRAALEPNVIPLAPQEMPATPMAPAGLMGALARRAPVGVVACITPYNFPIVNMAGKIGPALAMGNTVIVRPAPQDPLAVIELVRILDEVGFPPGVVNVVTGSSPATGQALVESPDVDMISFTGSTAVGLRIAEAGGRTMKRLLLELGKARALCSTTPTSPRRHRRRIRVDLPRRADLHRAERAIVHRSHYQEFVEGLAKMATLLPVGDPTDPKTVVGPLITGAHRERVEGYIRAGADEGAEVVTGGGRPKHLDRGFYVEPTLLSEVRGGMRVAREEIFGPVIVVETFDDDEEAIHLANDSDFGLYDYVFTGDSEKGFRTAGRLRSGNVGINTAQRNMEAPFGARSSAGSAATAGRSASTRTRAPERRLARVSAADEQAVVSDDVVTVVPAGKLVFGIQLPTVASARWRRRGEVEQAAASPSEPVVGRWWWTIARRYARGPTASGADALGDGGRVGDRRGLGAGSRHPRARCGCSPTSGSRRTATRSRPPRRSRRSTRCRAVG